MPNLNPRVTRHRIKITGIVQGVGFRPFVWNLAHELSLQGWVLNDSAGVTIEAQGARTTLDEFCVRLTSELPPLAMIDSWTAEEIEEREDEEFWIRESIGVDQRTTPVAPDVSVCDACKTEMFDEHNARYVYPFINCTNCGPRFTIVRDIPYDRPLTTMNAFPMCDHCRREYNDPANRRYHAQPNACHECGPSVWLATPLDSDDTFAFSNDRGEPAKIQNSLKAFETSIAEGKIVAVKGIGGFHLICDATNQNAVSKLRTRKGRTDKPFAVLVETVNEASKFASISEHERQILESRERPIVLLNKLPRSNVLAENVSPQNKFIGVILPYSPLHYLLMHGKPLLMTSGNLSDEPIVRKNLEAKRRLGKLVDAFLLHNREINVVCDDSVVRSVDNDVLPIRRSRGFAPMPVRLGDDCETVLAVGGEIKSTFCLTKGKYAFMSQHIGDMGNADTLDVMRRSVEHFIRLFDATPKAIAADLHPGYLSGQWAESFSNELGVPLFRIQHHFAHVASLAAEHGLAPEQRLIGCCFDGTGYGTDNSIWGGEFLIASTGSFERFAALNSFLLPGGDAAIKWPARTALGLLHAHEFPEQAWTKLLPSLEKKHRKLILKQLDRRLNCISTSSMGRLFDAVAALTGIRQQVNYEAQAAMELEAQAVEAINDVKDPYEFEILESDFIRLGTKKLIQTICEDVQRGSSPAQMAAKFHLAVANIIAKVCKLARRQSGLDTVGLTGGVFQNVLLLQLTQNRLQQEGFKVLTHSVTPPNDGGISLGQAVVASHRLRTLS